MIKNYIIFPLAALVCCAQLQAAEDWETNFKKACEQAQKEKKLLFIEFTGSDWCPPCMNMKKNVLSKDEFLTPAKEKFVLVELDFPNKKEIPAELKKQNDELAEKYEIEGYPTVIFADADGKEIRRVVGGVDMQTMLKNMEAAVKGEPGGKEQDADESGLPPEAIKDLEAFEKIIEEVDMDDDEAIIKAHQEFLKNDKLHPAARQQVVISMALGTMPKNGIDAGLKQLEEAKAIYKDDEAKVQSLIDFIKENRKEIEKDFASKAGKDEPEKSEKDSAEKSE